jgi:hypothetical protein
VLTFKLARHFQHRKYSDLFQKSLNLLIYDKIIEPTLLMAILNQTQALPICKACRLYPIYQIAELLGAVSPHLA